MLSKEKLENYFYFMRASAKDNIFTSVEKMSEDAKKIFEGLLKHSDLVFGQAKMAVDKMSVFAQHQILDGLYQDMISNDSYEKEKVRFFLLWGALNEQLQENIIKYCADLSAKKVSVSHIPYFEGFYAQCKNQGEMKTIEKWCTELVITKTFGIRTFWDMQQNQEIHKDADWQDKMVEIEMRVSDMDGYKDIAFFHHLIIEKSNRS